MKMRRRPVSLSVILITLGLLIATTPAIAAPDEVKLTIHYNRAAADYNGWNLWIWKNSDNNSQDVSVSTTGIQFTGEDDFGKIATVTLTGMRSFKDVGIIVRLNDWAAKDTSDDRFIDKFDAAGNAEVWLLQNDKNIYYEKPDIRLKIQNAYFEDLKRVKVELSKKYKPADVPSGGFTLDKGINVIKVTELNGDNAGATLFALDLDKSVSLTDTYQVSNSAMDSKVIALGNAMGAKEFEAAFTYTGDDLGNTYSKSKTSFRLWAPTASAVSLVTFANPDATSGTSYPMAKDVNGTWKTSLNGDRDGLIYMYAVTVNGTTNEVVDPYVRAATLNGRKGVVVDLASTNPAGWNSKKPKFSGKPTDAVIYELHVRDLSMDSSGPYPAEVRGKFAGLTYSDLKGAKGQPVGVAAIKDLGVTHLQLLPIYDYASVDEANPSFNWGYDPLNYNVPEGSYSSDPSEPKARIIELKRAIQALHNQGIRVIMDVVYNHVYDAGSFSQSKIVPGYWFRTNSDGSLTSASGCGNDTASERSMVSKFIVDSVKYWASEYNLSGFRFDLMGLHDLETMSKVRKELSKIDPSIIIIGEGWNMGTHPDEIRSTQRNIKKLPGISVFNDQIRDGVKGSVFNSAEKGFATGEFTERLNVKAGIVGNIEYGGDLTPKFTTLSPGQSVSYVEAHDNNTLADKIELSLGKIDSQQAAKLHRLAGSIPILSQGLPFIHAGQEFRRSKNGDSNSYKSSDAVNAIKWDLISTERVTRDYYKGLLQIRSQHPAFRMTTSAQVRKNLKFILSNDSVIAYRLDGSSLNDLWRTIVVVHNAGSTSAQVTLPKRGDWRIVVAGDRAGIKTLRTLSGASRVTASPLSTTLLYLP